MFMFQDPQWIPENTISAQTCTYYVLSYMPCSFVFCAELMCSPMFYALLLSLHYYSWALGLLLSKIKVTWMLSIVILWWPTNSWEQPNKLSVRSIYSVDVLDKGMIQVPERMRRSGTVGGFIILHRTLSVNLWLISGIIHLIFADHIYLWVA